MLNNSVHVLLDLILAKVVDSREMRELSSPTEKHGTALDFINKSKSPQFMNSSRPGRRIIRGVLICGEWACAQPA